MFGIWCEVWGSVTGSRAAWMKNNGKVKYFEDQAEAEAEAVKLNHKTNGNTYRSASFRYSVRNRRSEES